MVCCEFTLQSNNYFIGTITYRARLQSFVCNRGEKGVLSYGETGSIQQLLEVADLIVSEQLFITQALCVSLSTHAGYCSLLGFLRKQRARSVFKLISINQNLL
jgi:hypothetical protein